MARVLPVSVLLLLLWLQFVFDSVCVAVEVEIVALTGEMAPGTDARFSRIFQSREKNLNNQGQFVLRGELVGDGVERANDIGIWVYDPDTGLSQLVREGDAVPNSGGQFRSFSTHALNDNGELIFSGYVNGDNTVNTAIWGHVINTSGVSEVVRGADIAQVDNLSFAHFRKINIGDNGTVVFLGEMDDFLDREGIWRRDGSGNVELVAMEKKEAPGTSANYSSFGGYSANELGQIVHRSGLSDVNGGGSQNSGLWRDGLGGLELLARHGGSAPGTTAKFLGFGDTVEMNSHGQVVFNAVLMGDGVNGTNSSGIWKGQSGGSLELFMRSGNIRVPGADGKFGTFSDIAQNKWGRVVFSSTIESSDKHESGIWSEKQDGSLSLIALEGQNAPGVNLPFRDLPGGPLAVNGKDQVAFFAGVLDPDVLPRPIEVFGIWAQDIHGDLQLIVSDGDVIDVSSDPATPDLRTIAVLDFNPTNFNDAGQLLFTAYFMDGTSGIFISNAVAVPEPQSIILVVLCSFFSRRINLRRNVHLS